MINLRKNDALADAIKEILQQEALKGNQHLIDKNKNNEIDPEDFKILRGKKKAVKEEETVEEGIRELAKKAFKAFTGGSDEDQLKNLQGKMGVPQTGKKPTQKEEVEIVYEANIEPTSAKSRSHIGNLSNPTVNSVEHSGKQIGLITKQSNGQYHAHHSAAKLAHAAGNTFDNKDSAHQFIRNAHAKAIKSGTLSDRFLKKEEVQGKTLKQFKEGWQDMLDDVKKRAAPQPNGGAGMKQGSAYGGSKQKDKPEQATEKK